MMVTGARNVAFDARWLVEDAQGFSIAQTQKGSLLGVFYYRRIWRKLPRICLRIPPKYSVAQIMGYLKKKSLLLIFEQFPNLKYKYGNRHFWCKGYYVSIVGVNEETIKSIYGKR